MPPAWSRALVLIAAAALLSSAQCSSACAVEACKSPQVPADHCHHRKSAPGRPGCPHRHSVFAGPQSALTNVSFAVVVSPALVPAAFGGAGFSRRRTSVRLPQVSHRLSEAG